MYPPMQTQSIAAKALQKITKEQANDLNSRRHLN